jgi:hypothetical protein
MADHDPPHSMKSQDSPKMGFGLGCFTFCQTPIPQWTLGISCQSGQQALGFSELAANYGVEFAPRSRDMFW